MNAFGGALELTEATVATKGGPRTVLVVAPRARVVAGRERLEELRASLKPGAIDLQLVREVRRRRGRLDALLMRGRSADGNGEWRLDPSLSDDDRAELGYLLAKSHLPNHRRFMVAGICVYVHTDFADAELEMFKVGAERLRGELEASVASRRGDEDEAATERVDLWVLKNLSFWFGISAERVLAEILPEQLPMFEARRPHMQAMIRTLPRASR